MLFDQISLNLSLFFTKTSLKRAVQFLIKNSYFTFGYVLLLQATGIPIRVVPAPLEANLYLYGYESKYITNLIVTNKLRVDNFTVRFALLTTFVP